MKNIIRKIFKEKFEIKSLIDIVRLNRNGLIYDTHIEFKPIDEPDTIILILKNKFIHIKNGIELEKDNRFFNIIIDSEIKDKFIFMSYEEFVTYKIVEGI